MPSRKYYLTDLICWCLVLSQVVVLATEIQASSLFVPESCGALEVDGFNMRINHFGEGWSLAEQKNGTVEVRSGYPRVEGNSRVLNGTLKTPSSGNLEFVETITMINKQTIRLDVDFANKDGIKTNELSLNLKIPVREAVGKSIDIDNKKIVLPDRYREPMLFSSKKKNIGKIVIPLATGILTIETEKPVILQDSRKWGGEFFELRVLVAPRCGVRDLKNASISMVLKFKHYHSEELNLIKFANSSFPNLNEQSIPSNKLNIMGLTFRLIGGDRNSSDKCVVLPPGKMVSIQPANGKYNYLYLLAALLNTSIPAGETGGVVSILYKDGSRDEYDLRNQIEIGQYYHPASLPDSPVIWSAPDKQKGLYLVRIGIKPIAIDSIDIQSVNNTTLLLAAASISEMNFKIPENTKYTIKESGLWRPVKYHKDVRSGGIMDFSFLLDAPAGKYGFLKADEEALVFGDKSDKPVRFFGINLCFSANYLEKNECVKLADRLARMGYNAVRIHHHDNEVERHGKRSVAIKKEKLDKLHYFIYCLKKRGIYITTDLYTYRQFEKGEFPELPEREFWINNFKALPYVLESAMCNWREFARGFLETVNPYTKLALKDDPVLICLNLINENPITYRWNNDRDVKKLYLQHFNGWLKTRGQDSADKNEKKKLFNQFLVEVYNKNYQKMLAFLRSIGVKTLITDINCGNDIILAFMRENLELVDNHSYWDHPTFPVKNWQWPISIKNKSVLEELAQEPGNMFPTRIVGKPMIITEFASPYPNRFRAESGLVYGSYASLQNWNGLFGFAYSHSKNRIFNDTKINMFDIAADPIHALSDKMALLLFLRGDVKSAGVSFPTILSNEFLKNDKAPEKYPETCRLMGLIGKTGTLVMDSEKTDDRSFFSRLFSSIWGDDKSFPDGTVAVTGFKKHFECQYPYYELGKSDEAFKLMVKNNIISQNWCDYKNKVFTSQTGQITLNGREKSFRVATDFSEGLVLPEQQHAKGSCLAVRNILSRGVFFAGALDQKALRKSERIIIFHLTDAQNSNTVFKGNNLALHKGTLPRLVRKGKAVITIKHEQPEQLKLYAVNFAGERLGPVTFERQHDSIKFIADNFSEYGVVMAYELTK